jgi:uncharacterized protein (TIGR02246 family)
MARGLLLVALVLPAAAQAETAVSGDAVQQVGAPAPIAAEPTPAQLHEELRALKATMEKAMNEMDIDTILANVTEDVVFTTMNGDVARRRDGIRTYFETMMKGPNPRVKRVQAKFEADDLSHLYGNDLAISFGSSKDQYTLAGGESFVIDARWSGTMVRRDGRWLIASFHYSTNLFDNPVLDAQRKIMVTAAIGMAVAVAVIAFLIGRARGRRRAK